jgi:20S proteasome alpha/beta subunit
MLKTRWILFLVLACWMKIRHVVPSSFSYNAYNYDLTTPLFTPDGRLLQVEYAYESSRHSPPLLAIPCSEGVVLATVQYFSRRYPHRLRRQQQQTRFVELLLGSSCTFNTTVAVVGLSGVIADNIALLQHARKYLDSYTRSYGSHPQHGFFNCYRLARHIANVIGDACQSHALGGGLRPYGASLLVCSVEHGGMYYSPPKDDSIDETCHPSSVASIAITHPSGAVYSTIVNNGVNQRSYDPNVFIVGGSSQVQAKLRQRIQHLLNSRTREENDMLSFKTTVHVAIESLLEEYDRHRKEQQQHEPPTEENMDAEMEILIMSPKHGTHRLSYQDTQLLISRIREQQKESL